MTARKDQQIKSALMKSLEALGYTDEHWREYIRKPTGKKKTKSKRVRVAKGFNRT